MPRLALLHHATRPSRRLLVVGAVATVVAGTALVTGAPAQAAAPARTLTATFAGTTGVTSGTVAVSGTLTDSATGTTVALQRQDGKTWTTVQTATTTSTGSYTAAVPLPATAGTYPFRGYVAAQAGASAAKSATTKIAVATRVSVTLAASPQAVASGNPVALTGTVNPFLAGGKVVIDAVAGTNLQAVAKATIAADGSFTASVTPTTSTTYRATVAARTGFAAGASPDVTVSVGAAVIVRTALAAGTVGTAYTGRLTTQGNLAGTWSVVGANGFAPLTLNPTTGAITGTPTKAGDTTVTVAFTVTATGLRDTASVTVHVDVAPTTPVPGPVVVSAGDSHTCRVAADHTLSCWGFDVHGQLGYPVNLQQPYETRPRQVGTVATWVSVSAGSYYDTCGVRSDYTLWCWGYNTDGEVGDGTNGERSTPVQVAGDQHWRSVSVGDAHTCAVSTAGGLWCWGANNSGQAGLGSTPFSRVPAQVGTASDWTTVAAGGYDTCGLRGRGTLWCWGTNYQGQLGTGTAPTGVSTPTRVGTAADWKSVDVGASVCGTRAGGTLWCWGLNRSGSVGDGTTTDRSTPQPIGTGTTWSSVTAGNQHTCAVRTDASLWCWGDNGNGTVGDGTTGTNRLVPTAVSGGGTWASTTVGGSQGCAVRTDGSTWCWGGNVWGQLGIGTRADTGVPTRLGS